MATSTLARAARGLNDGSYGRWVSVDDEEYIYFVNSMPPGYYDRLRAKGAEDRMRSVLKLLDGLASAEGDPCCAAALRNAFWLIEAEFPPATPPTTKETP